MTSQWDKSQFVKMLADALGAIAELPDVAHASLIAMAALESGWGSTEQARSNSNFWNLTAGSIEHGRSPSWPDPKPVTVGMDKEPKLDSAGRPVRDAQGQIIWIPVHQYWRVYATPQESVEDFLRAMSWPRYQPARDALMAGQNDRFIDFLGPDRVHQSPVVGGWYTLPTTQYLASQRACLAEVLALIASPVA